jgi:hypothetical protein
MDKIIGKLDDIENQAGAIHLLRDFNLEIGMGWEFKTFALGASQSKPALTTYYKQTNQQFLAKYEFPTHNQFFRLFFIKYGI